EQYQALNEEHRAAIKASEDCDRKAERINDEAKEVIAKAEDYIESANQQVRQAHEAQARSPYGKQAITSLAESIGNNRERARQIIMLLGGNAPAMGLGEYGQAGGAASLLEDYQGLIRTAAYGAVEGVDGEPTLADRQDLVSFINASYVQSIAAIAQGTEGVTQADGARAIAALQAAYNQTGASALWEAQQQDGAMPNNAEQSLDNSAEEIIVEYIETDEASASAEADSTGNTNIASSGQGSVQIESESPTGEGSYKTLSEYMNAHNYAIWDYTEYSKDPEWIRLHEQEFPNWEGRPTRQIETNATPTLSIEGFDLPSSVHDEYRATISSRLTALDETTSAIFSRYQTQLAYAELNAKVYSRDTGLFQPSSWYSATEDAIYLNQDEDLVNPLGAGNTFFHESGHQIDFQAGQGLPLSYQRGFADAVKEDYETHLQTIKDSLGCDDATARAHFRAELRRCGNAANCPSDVFGGLTDNEVSNGWGHDKEYWQGADRDIRIATEAWAELLADGACGDKYHIECARHFLPRTYKLFEKMREELSHD
ncbi:MAG: hypothetical protein IKE20_07195, partial [Eggerthellaceae bacterium]|nr:hypothetical protein [Eggerthellaceae bacterium]